MANAVEQVEPAVRDDHVTGEVPDDTAADPGGLVAAVRIQEGGREVQLLLSRKDYRGMAKQYIPCQSHSCTYTILLCTSSRVNFRTRPCREVGKCFFDAHGHSERERG